MTITETQKREVREALDELKGKILTGTELEKYITKLYPPKKRFVWMWSIKDNMSNCTYMDDADNMVNKYYIHVEVFEGTYTDLLCIINNASDPVSEWAILVKEVIRQ